MNAIDEILDRHFEELRMLREELHAGFAALRVEIAGARTSRHFSAT
jgi:hypothetical protein